MTPEFPNKKYKIIYADPPWEYDSHNVQGQASNEYPVMPFEDILSLPVEQLADDDCMLFLWVTSPFMQEGLDLIKKWGFEYKTIAFVWEKTNLPVGLGHYTRINHEFVLLGRRGKFERQSTKIRQAIKANNKGHSQKPSQVRDRIIELCGDLPRIELFARTKVHGWDTWGNDPKLDNTPLEQWINP